MPVLKITGSRTAAEKMIDHIDMNLSAVIDGGDKAFDPPELPTAPLLNIDEMDVLDVIEVR